MRLFQNSGTYAAYLVRLDRLAGHSKSFSERRDIFFNDRYGACHILQPIHSGDESAFYTNGDDLKLQRLWAAEQGLKVDSSPADILLAQIEHHRTDVFYNTDPVRFGPDFLRRLPGHVKRTVCWRAAPSGQLDLSGYHRVVNNFPAILANYCAAGLDARYFFPAHDDVLNTYAARTDRPIDILFVGGYSQHHKRRAEVMAAVASLHATYEVRFCLQRSRLTKLAESFVGGLLPLGRHRRPDTIRAVSAEPVFGRDLYDLLSQAKVVLNGAIDMAENDRGNIRCFESLGAGCAMVSDTGRYPEHFIADQTHLEYDNSMDAMQKISELLTDSTRLNLIAENGRLMLAEHYSASRQWQAFVALCA